MQQLEAVNKKLRKLFYSHQKTEIFRFFHITLKNKNLYISHISWTNLGHSIIKQKKIVLDLKESLSSVFCCSLGKRF